MVAEDVVRIALRKLRSCNVTINILIFGLFYCIMSIKDVFLCSYLCLIYSLVHHFVLFCTV